ncbi:MAG: TrbC/VirB2 family protein [Elusimicrobia bacterium]|nr:TrbC/VirB2 family protein [Elusimicrobiota bacterium]MDE2424455.1 TrbC/VirB2 family protein [Elusimicrobiota bacterium]
MKKKTQNQLAAAAMMMLLAAPSFAQVTGNSSQVGTFLSSSANWLVTILGPGLFLIGVIMVGINMALGNEDAMRKGFFVIGGGALIFLANPIVALLKSLSGS